VLGFLRARATAAKRTGVAARWAVSQRFGGALHLNLHVHALVLDGVFARNRAAS
jgi:hypothetical protein